MSMAGERETQLQAAATAPPGVLHRNFHSRVLNLEAEKTEFVFY